MGRNAELLLGYARNEITDQDTKERVTSLIRQTENTELIPVDGMRLFHSLICMIGIANHQRDEEVHLRQEAERRLNGSCQEEKAKEGQRDVFAPRLKDITIDPKGDPSADDFSPIEPIG